MAPTQTEEKVCFCGPPWWKCYCMGFYVKRWENNPARHGSGKEKPAQPDQSHQTSGEKSAQPDKSQQASQKEKPAQSDQDVHFHLLPTGG